MKSLFPKKLKIGDKVMVVAPSSSLGIISEDVRRIANARFESMGLEVVFGDNVLEMDNFRSSSIESRVSDIHKAFSDESIKGVFAVIGGYNCNQLLRYIDWDIIRNNPKVFVGFSDTTALQNAMYAKTGLVTYSGPSYSTFGQELYFDYTMEYVQKCLFEYESFSIESSDFWTDDAWYMDQKNRKLNENNGWLVVNEGGAEGVILGANICTFNLLHGTEYLPSIEGSVLFLEDDASSKLSNFDRDLQSVIHLPGFDKVRGLVIGRFQKDSDVDDGQLVKAIKSKKELYDMPVLANVDFGHTSPIITFPIGGEVELSVSSEGSALRISKH